MGGAVSGIGIDSGKLDMGACLLCSGQVRRDVVSAPPGRF